MIRAIAICCMIGFAAIEAGAAEIVEIPLAGLVGTYGSGNSLCYSSRTASFQLDRIPDTVYAVSIRMSGTLVVGEMHCEWAPPTTEPKGLYFDGGMKDSLNSVGWGAHFGTPDESSAFENQVQFIPSPGATWEYLKSGRGDVSIHTWAGNNFVECWMVTCPLATVTEAVLVIEADFPVSTRESSWGAIKSLYR